MGELLFTVRCKGSRCTKILGMVDERGWLITESTNPKRWWIKTAMKEGTVECKKCDNVMTWSADKFNKNK